MEEQSQVDNNMRGSAKRKMTSSSSYSKRKDPNQSFPKQKSAIAKEELQDLSNNIVDVSLDVPAEHQMIGGWSIRHSPRKGTTSSTNIDRYNHTTHIIPTRVQHKRSQSALRPRTSMVTRTGIACSNVYVSRRPKCSFVVAEYVTLAKQQPPMPRCTYTPLLYTSCKKEETTPVAPIAIQTPSDMGTYDRTQTNRSFNNTSIRSPFKRNIYLDRWKQRAGRETMKRLLFQNLHQTPLRLNKQTEQLEYRKLRTEADLDQISAMAPMRTTRCKSIRNKKEKSPTQSFRSNTQESEQCLMRIEMRMRQYGEQPKKYLSHMTKIHQLIRQEHVRLDTSEY